MQQLAVVLHAVARTLREALVGIERGVFEALVRIVVRTEVEFDELGQLSDLLGHGSVESETADVDLGDTAVGVDLNARLIAPQVGILVEVPV